MREGNKNLNDMRIQCDIAGGGKKRGPHNCGNCDKNFLDAISNFSIYQDINVFKNLNCDCYEKWLDIIDIEELGFGSLSNTYG